MKTKEPVLNENQKKQIINHIHHLERQQSYLLSLKNQLNSYHCVPKTKKLYEQMELLRHRLQELSEENEKLIFSVNTSEQASKDSIKSSNQQFKKVVELEHAILEYIGKAKIHG